ncbi:MAG: DUF420 domain-containing protein, partial [Planctomycetota bacterium]
MKRFSPRCKWPVNAASDQRHGMSTLTFVLGSLLWCAVLGAMFFVMMKKPAPKIPDPVAADADSQDDPDADDGKPKSLVIRFPSKPLPEFEFAECLGGQVSRDSLKGRRWLAVFVFTRCVETCPMITRHVAELHKKVAESNPDFQFVTFSVDSSHDTAEVLKKYAETFNADHDRWKFLTGDEQTIHNLIRTGFTQYVAPNLGEKRKPGYEVAHTNRAVLVNEDGIPVATYLMTDPEEVVRLRRVIEGKTEFPTPVDGDSPVVGADGNPAVQFTPVPTEQQSAEPTKPSNEASGTGDAIPEQDGAASREDSAPTTSSSDQSISDMAPAGESAETRNERIEKALPGWVSRLPSVNALLNALCTMLLVAGFAAIRGGKRTVHRNLMVAAFGVSVIFLASYVTYHEALHKFTGERGRAFIGSDLAKMAYFAILIPHVILAIFVPILALRVFWLSWKERWPEHRRLARITLPIWLFVSI